MAKLNKIEEFQEYPSAYLNNSIRIQVQFSARYVSGTVQWIGVVKPDPYTLPTLLYGILNQGRQTHCIWNSLFQ